MPNSITFTTTPDPVETLSLARRALMAVSETGLAALLNAAITAGILILGYLLFLEGAGRAEHLAFAAGLATASLAYLGGLAACGQIKQSALRKALREDAEARGPAKITLTAKGFTAETRHGKTEIPWAGIRAVEDHKSGLVLVTSGFGVVLLADADLPASVTRNLLRSTIAKWREEGTAPAPKAPTTQGASPHPAEPAHS
ncbi:MAG: hypothetical protein AAFY59_10915 [Pseudomonadota bacterium]